MAYRERFRKLFIDALNDSVVGQVGKDDLHSQSSSSVFSRDSKCQLHHIQWRPVPANGQCGYDLRRFLSPALVPSLGSGSKSAKVLKALGVDVLLDFSP